MGHIRPLRVRDPNEGHRAATPLELLFDLVAVIAIATAAHGLRHAIGHDHVVDGLIGFVFAFFAIWWPWNQFTWFASSFDNDDALYRLKVMLFMFGAMFVAASMSVFFEGGVLDYALAGYILMRVAQILLWVRVLKHNSEHRLSAIRYIVGLIMIQSYWAAIIFGVVADGTTFKWLFALGFTFELLLPLYAERKSTTPRHTEHLMERFGLLIIIVLGEVLLSSVEALRNSVSGGFNGDHIVVAICGILITFSMWWYYFYEPERLEQFSFKRAFEWGYGHVLIFGSAAAVGAGLGLLLDIIEQEQGELISLVLDKGQFLAGTLTVSISIALYITGLWFVRDRHQCQTGASVFLLIFALGIAFAAFLPYALITITILMVLCVVFRISQIDRAKSNCDE